MTVRMTGETVFTYGAPQLKFGRGAADEIGFDLGQYGARRVLVVTDPGDSGPGTLRQAITDANANPGPDSISFQIGVPGSSQTIRPTVRSTSRQKPAYLRPRK